MAGKKSAHGGQKPKQRKTGEPEAVIVARALLKTRKRKSGRAYYDDDERAAILAAVDANGGNVQGTAKLLGVPMSTIACWKAGHRCPEALQLRNEKRNQMADALEEIVWAILAQMPAKIEAAPLNHLSTSAGILIDKTRLLREQATAISDVHQTTATIDVTKLTPEEREYLIELHDRASIKSRALDTSRITPAVDGASEGRDK
jgi:hypothetical protein